MEAMEVVFGIIPYGDHTAAALKEKYAGRLVAIG